MIRSKLETILNDAVAAMIGVGRLPQAAFARADVSDPRSPEHGDYATNFAMVNAKAFGMNPRQLGEALAEALAGRPEFQSVEVAGPGFVNLRLRPEFVASILPEILAKGGDLPKSKHPSPLKINVEFVSVNPNGPITVGSGRGAAFGSTLCNVLEAAGHTVHREYYINDGVNSEQMRLFAESVQSYVEGTPFPEKGYKGDYVQEVAEAIKAEVARDGRPADPNWYRKRSEQIMIESQRAALKAFGVEFDTWFSEQSLHDSGLVQKCLEELQAKGVADEQPYRTVLKLGKKGEIQEVVKQSQTNGAEDDDMDSDAPEAEGAATAPTLW